MNEHGNDDRMTYNYGHDIAKTRLSSKLKNNGFNIYEIRKAIFSHPEIKLLLERKAIAIGKIIGQNFTVGAKDDLLSNYRKVNYVNKDVTVIQQVNNILNSILKQYGFKGYGKTNYWKTVHRNGVSYPKRITVGADILSYDWIKENYSQTQFTCKLNDMQKSSKYR